MRGSSLSLRHGIRLYAWLLVALVLGLYQVSLSFQQLNQQHLSVLSSTSSSARSAELDSNVAAEIILRNNDASNKDKHQTNSSSSIDTSPDHVSVSANISSRRHYAASSAPFTSQQQQPWFILHVGPPKTATTTLQCGLHALSRELLELDQYVYLGKPCDKPPLNKERVLGNGETPFPAHSLYNELEQQQQQQHQLFPLGQHLQQRLEHHWRHNRSVVVSVEKFSRGFSTPQAWRLLKDKVLRGWHKNRHNIRIVVSYRRYFEWITSYYYLTRKGRKGVGLTLPQYLEEALQNNTTRTQQQHPTSHTRQLYAAHFSNVHLFNLKQQQGNNDGDSNNVLTNFVCQMLPNANNTCQKLKQGHKAAEKQQDKSENSTNNARTTTTAHQTHRVSLSLDAFKFYHHYNHHHNARQQYQLRNSQIGQVAARLTKFERLHPETYRELQTCLKGPALERLWNVSVAWERELLPYLEPYPPPPDLPQAFNDAVAQRRFCELDAARALENKELVAFVVRLDKAKGKD